ncbi:hypothetical protein MAPG_03678 [Magnaporthiopsis poae ATCC 64411]|uniref:Uncharacterized protein n=1 Tax=Magnaporthiopsis poae (strain ATCC 64411 / 73-15) TaxID=644358 RepID=A0A0C4DUN7_MAGP6|nr:hypothetical protein MAPG_03678 [Magnaporthiopsis poae ATCC 64411]
MALSLATIQEAVGYIKLALEVYNEIQAVPEEIAELKIELEGLGAPLSTLANLLKDPKETEPLGRLDSKNRKALVDAVQDASAACKEVHSVFKNVKSRHLGYLGGHDIRARAEWVAWAWHRFGFGAEKVKGLMHRIKVRCQNIQFILTVINIIPKKRLQADIEAKQKEKAALEKSRKEIQFLKADAAKKDAQLQAINARLETLVDALVKTKAEAKKAKERECMDTATAVNGQVQKKPPKATTKPAKKAEKEPPGPGHLAKTPSIGPKVIRGVPEGQKPKDEGKVKSEQKGKAKIAKPEEKTNGNTKEKSAGKTNGDAKEKKEDKVKESKPAAQKEQKEQKEAKPKENKNDKKKDEKPKEKTDAGTKPPVINQPKPPKSIKAAKPARPPKPSPSPPRSGHSILFVDPGNLERSVVCQAMLLLLDYTARKSGDRPLLTTVQSAGYFVENQSDCIDEIKSLPHAIASFNLPMTKGNESPFGEALDLLFQPNSDGSGTAPWWKGCDPDSKAKLEKVLRARRSVGMRREFFRKFDYIVCFTRREHENLLRLREAIVAKNGAEGWPKDKGKVLHLGAYLSEDGKPAQTISQATNDRSTWPATISRLKTALEIFLVKELKWERSPSKGSST